MRSSLYHTRPSKLDIFGELRSINNFGCYGLSVNDAIFDNKLEYYSNFCIPCVESPVNKNLNGPHKYLLLYHLKLVVGMYHIQEFRIENIYDDPTAKNIILPPIIINKFTDTMIFLFQIVTLLFSG